MDEEDPSPPKKKKTTACYKQKFKDSWKETFDFIESKDGLPKCKVCDVTLKGGISHIKRHKATNSHIKKYNSAKNTPAINMVFNKPAFKSLNDEIRELEMHVVGFLCEENLPFSLADKLTFFLKKVFPQETAVRNLKLKRQKATQLAVKIMAPYAKDVLFSRIKKEKFSIIIDETTDIGSSKSLAILARFFNEEKNCTNDVLLSLIEVKDATAVGLFNAIKQLLDDNVIPYSNIVGFGADNANVMMGDLNGVRKKLTEICPGIVVQRCNCHNLHLSASNACKKLPTSVEQFVRDIYTYFSHSVKRSNELKEFQIFAEEKPSKMLYPSQTRWLSLKVK